MARLRGLFSGAFSRVTFRKSISKGFFKLVFCCPARRSKEDPWPNFGGHDGRAATPLQGPRLVVSAALCQGHRRTPPRLSYISSHAHEQRDEKACFPNSSSSSNQPSILTSSRSTRSIK